MGSYLYKHKNGIFFRKIEEGDIPLLKELKDESWFGTHHITIVNMYNQQQWFEKNSNDKTSCFLIALDNGKNPVGMYKISEIDFFSRCCNMSYDVFKNSRGKHYAKKILEAGTDFTFEIFNLNRINTEVLENNVASEKSLLHVGFIIEGIKRKSIWKINDYLDSKCLGMLFSDWKNSERIKSNNGCSNTSYTPKNNL